VIEDNDQNFELVEFLLSECAWSLQRARDGVAVERLLGLDPLDPPDLVLLDMNLPDVSGIDLARRLRALPAFERVPLVAVTAHAMRGDRERFLEAGCDAYVAKPIDTAYFRALLDRFAVRGRR